MKGLLYFSPIKMAKERREIDESIALMEKHLAACHGQKVELGGAGPDPPRIRRPRLYQ